MMTEEFKKLLAMLIAHHIPFYFSPPNKFGGGYVYGYKDKDTIYNRIWELDDATIQDNTLVFFADPQYDDVGNENVPAEEMIKYILDREYTENGVDYNE